MLCNAYDDMSSFNARSKHRGVTAAMRVWEAQAIGGGGCRCEGEEVKYGTLGVNPVVL